MPTASPRAISRPRAFTLTEIMIALALVALLLVGISRIFAITSTTISSGQALAKAMRSQKAIQTSLSGDFFGVGDIGNPAFQNGMMPLVNTADKDYAAPFLTISNFRVAAYKNQDDFASDVIQPAEPTAPLTATQFQNRSLAIRGVDLNKDGVENPNPPSITGGETIPLYAYGERNFRTDTISFFSKGVFKSQTDHDDAGTIATSNESWIWYGHLKTYNSEPNRLDYANAYGAPGNWLTAALGPNPGVELSNRNNRFADDFRLGRVQNLLIDPTVVNGNQFAADANSNDGVYRAALQQTAVLKNRDPSQPVIFTSRDWWGPTDLKYGTVPGVTITRPNISPFDIDASLVRLYKNGQSRVVYSDDRLAGDSPATASPIPYLLQSSRTDVMGVDVKDARKRVIYLEEYDDLVPPTGSERVWWKNFVALWEDRFWVNPFVGRSQFQDSTVNNITPRSLSQRNQILAEACSQFIVEFAGDFVTQNQTSGAVGLAQPDGYLDFVVVDGVKHTRWYGLPRDVDGDGVIAGWGNTTGMQRSLDVVPLADFADARTGSVANPSSYNFERQLPPITQSSTADYLRITTEPNATPANGTNPNGTTPNGTSYITVWGPSDFQRSVDIMVGTQTVTARPVPQLIRIIADIRDPNGKLKDAVSQEFIFPVRVTAAIEPPKTP